MKNVIVTFIMIIDSVGVYDEEKLKRMSIMRAEFGVVDEEIIMEQQHVIMEISHTAVIQSMQSL